VIKKIPKVLRESSVDVLLWSHLIQDHYNVTPKKNHSVVLTSLSLVLDEELTDVKVKS